MNRDGSLPAATRGLRLPPQEREAPITACAGVPPDGKSMPFSVFELLDQVMLDADLLDLIELGLDPVDVILLVGKD